MTHFREDNTEGLLMEDPMAETLSPREQGARNALLEIQQIIRDAGGCAADPIYARVYQIAMRTLVILKPEDAGPLDPAWPVGYAA